MSLSDDVTWARLQYARAVSVAQQWQQTATLTSSTQHRAVAETCHRIAQERFAELGRLESRMALRATKSAQGSAGPQGSVERQSEGADEMLGQPDLAVPGAASADCNPLRLDNPVAPVR